MNKVERDTVKQLINRRVRELHNVENLPVPDYHKVSDWMPSVKPQIKENKGYAE